SVVSGSPSLTTTATDTSPGGNYPIVVSQGTLSAANYTFAFKNGTLTVEEAPAFSTALQGSLPAGGTGGLQIQATGFPAPTFALAPGNVLPPWLSLSPTGFLSGSPPADAGGLYTFHLTITNSAGSATGTFTLLVNQPTVITSSNSA